MKDLQWIDDIVLENRSFTHDAAVNTECSVGGAELPKGCAAVIYRLLAGSAAEKGYKGLAEKIEKYLSGGDNFPALQFDVSDEKTLACIIAGSLENYGGLTGEEKNFIAGSRAVVSGMAMYVCSMARAALKNADIAVSMNLEAIRGELGAFDRRLHELARPYPGQIESAENVRRITAGSQLTTDAGRYAFGYDKKPRVQDAICVRATPQTHGGARDIFHWCEAQVLADWNGNSSSLYRTEYAMDVLATALADLAHISERRSFRLNDTRLSYGLPMNLVPDELGINYGFPIVQSTQAAETAELKLLTLPSAAIKRENKSYAYYAVCKMFELIMKLNRVMAVEMLMSAQGLDIVHAKIPDFAFGAGTEAAYKRLRQDISMMDENRFVAPDMIRAEKLVSGRAILEAVEAAVGELK